MAILLQYQVGTCWSNVTPDELAGGLSYYATLQDAAKAALDYGTGIKPMEVYVDLVRFPEYRLDYLGKPFKYVNKNWSDVMAPVIRMQSVLEHLAGL